MVKRWAFVVFVVFPAYLLSSKKYDDPKYWEEWRKNAPPWFD